MVAGRVERVKSPRRLPCSLHHSLSLPLLPSLPTLDFFLFPSISPSSDDLFSLRWRMETARPAHADLGGFLRTVTKIVRFRRRTKNGTTTGIGVVSEDGSIGKVKFPECFDDVSLPSQSDFLEEDEKKRQQQLLHDREAMESLLAKLFASVSAVKAAYAQLQMAQSPYDPDTIQSADQVVVSELKQLSQLKQSFYRKQIHGGSSARDSQLLAEMQEQRNLIKAFQITAKKMESDLQHKDAEILLLTDQLSEAEKLNKCMEGKVHPERSLQMLDGLCLSALNPTHFLAVLRYAVKSIRSFAKVMVQEMERAGWDLDAAAASIERDVLCGKPEHRAFAFESYVCRTLFSDFQHHDFALCNHHVSCPLLDRRQRFFEEFTELKLARLKRLLSGQNPESAFTDFCRTKYLRVVHPRMEESFFGNLDQRALVGSGNGFPETEFFLSFAEMARRVWLLHRLFFSFEPEAASIFQASKGCRFSEVFMESVADPEGASVSQDWNPLVGFTVVPGFKVGKTVIQCNVYLATAGAQR